MEGERMPPSLRTEGSTPSLSLPDIFDPDFLSSVVCKSWNNMRMPRSDWNSGWKYFDDTERFSSNGRERRITCTFCKKEMNCNQTKCRIHLARCCKGNIPDQVREFFFEEMVQLMSDAGDDNGDESGDSSSTPVVVARKSQHTGHWPPPASSTVRPAKRPCPTTNETVNEDGTVTEEEETDHTYKKPAISFLNPETGERDETIEELVASVNQLKQELREVRRQNEAVRLKLQRLSKEQLIDIILTSTGEPK